VDHHQRAQTGRQHGVAGQLDAQLLGHGGASSIGCPLHIGQSRRVSRTFSKKGVDAPAHTDA
ncbi:MAG: hypothetical protein KC549_02335, partial [Myxococcales bacterium]|nr:hypothetical protein [Myxococcales bacterium]